MSYDDFGWQNTPSTASPLSAANLEGFGEHVLDQALDQAQGNIRNFGAVLNGIADDTDAINAAIDALGADDGEVIIPSDGMAKITERIILPDGVTLRMGSGGRVFSGTGGVLCAAADAGITVQGSGGICDGWLIDGNGVATNPLLVEGGRKFINVTVKDAVEDNIRLHYVQNATFDQLTSVGAGQDGLVLDYGCGGLVFSNYQGVTAGRHGIRFGDNSGVGEGVYVQPTEILFNGGRSERNGSGDTCLTMEAGSTTTFQRFGFGGPDSDPGGVSTLVDLVSSCLEITFDDCEYVGGYALARALRIASDSSAKVRGGYYDTPAGFVDVTAPGWCQISERPLNFTSIPLTTSPGMRALVSKALGPSDYAWIAPTLDADWANLGSGYATAGYRMDASGHVEMQGTVVRGGGAPPAAEVLFTLPAGYRPGGIKLFLAIAASDTDYTGRVDVLANGEVQVNSAGSAYLSLDQVRFLAEA